MCNAYVEIRLLFLMYRLCSLCFVATDLPDCHTYQLLQVLHLNLYIPLEFVPVPAILSVSWCSTAVHKETELFLKNYCFTYNLIKLVIFKVLPSPLFIHRSQLFFHSWNAFWNVFCWTARKSCVEFSSISSTVWNRWRFSEDFHFGNKKKSVGVKSGE